MVERMEVRSFLAQVTVATYFGAAVAAMDTVVIGGYFIIANRTAIKVNHGD